MASDNLVALDIGERRIGVAVADSAVKISVPYDTIDVDGTEVNQIVGILQKESAIKLIIGYPRNQSGEPTAQTQFVVDFVASLPVSLAGMVAYQDESLTSVHAEQQLKANGRPYAKGDIDKVAASIILQDYLEEQYGRL